MSLLKPNGLPDRELIKTTVFAALHNAGQRCSSLSKSSMSITQRLRTFKTEDANCFAVLSLRLWKEALNGRICQMLLCCQDGAVSVMVTHVGRRGLWFEIIQKATFLYQKIAASKLVWCYTDFLFPLLLAGCNFGEWVDCKVQQYNAEL